MLEPDVGLMNCADPRAGQDGQLVGDVCLLRPAGGDYRGRLRQLLEERAVPAVGTKR